MTGEANVTDTIREQAAEWLIRLDTDEAPDQQQKEAFHNWLAQDGRHRRVFDQMEQLWHAARPARKASRPGRALSMVGLFLLTAFLGIQMPWQYWRADHHTAVGEIKAITLADGSVATLNTNSAIDVDLDHDKRRITLIRGEVLLDVRKQQQRPFVITTPTVTAEALGTRYSVERRRGHSLVNVYESRVRISTADGGKSAVLKTGQHAQVDKTGIRSQDNQLPASPDWARQRLIFQDAPLAEVVERLGQYHSGILKLNGDTDYAQRRFTGVLPSDDTGAAIELLASAMGLEVHSFSSYFIYLNPRPSP